MLLGGGGAILTTGGRGDQGVVGMPVVGRQSGWVVAGLVVFGVSAGALSASLLVMAIAPAFDAGLAVLVAVLGVVVGGLWWRRQPSRGRRAFWVGVAGGWTAIFALVAVWAYGVSDEPGGLPDSSQVDAVGSLQTFR